MQPIEHSTNNVKMLKPKDWDESTQGPCLDLKATVLPNCLVSFWKPSPEELEVLNANGSIALFIHGQQMPPVWVDVVDNK